MISNLTFYYNFCIAKKIDNEKFNFLKVVFSPSKFSVKHLALLHVWL